MGSTLLESEEKYVIHTFFITFTQFEKTGFIAKTFTRLEI